VQPRPIEPERATGDHSESDLHDVVLLSADPGAQGYDVGAVGLVLAEQAGAASDDHAGGPLVDYPVDLEGHRAAQRDREQLLAGRGAEEQRLAVDRIVDRHDVDLIDHREGQPAELLGAKELPALLVAELLHALVIRLLHPAPPAICGDPVRIPAEALTTATVCLPTCRRQ